MNKLFLGASLVVALFLVFLAGVTLIADSHQLAGAAKPFVDMQTVDPWVVGASLLIAAVAFAAAGVFFAWRDHQGVPA